MKAAVKNADQPAVPPKDLCQLVAIGSVDDGKSTLIGRLLYESGAVYSDQIEAVRSESIDFAALTDGLMAEREQGITIDVAYRYWDTPTRRFIIADTPGHLQYTRNMVTGASRAHAAIILIDARLGVLEQSRRHAYIATLLGVHTLVVAVNKMDLVGYSPSVFREIETQFRADLARLGRSDVQFVPISALSGDNVTCPSAKMSWFKGSCLVDRLTQIRAAPIKQAPHAVLPVQLVLRTDNQPRRYAGTLQSGQLQVGDAVTALPSRQTSTIRALYNPSDQLDQAFAPMATQISLHDELDLSRGDVLVSAGHPGTMHDRIEAQVVWMHQAPLVPSRSYFLKFASQQVSGAVTKVLERMDMQTLTPVSAQTLQLNEIGRCELTLSEPCLVQDYAQHRGLGSFIIIDRASLATVGAGMVQHLSKGEATGADLQAEPLDATRRAARFFQRPTLVRFARPAGQSQAALERLAAALENRLMVLGHLAYLMPAAPDPQRGAKIDALLDSGQLVLDLGQDPIDTSWTTLELGVAPKLPLGEQVSKALAQLIARGSIFPQGSSAPSVLS